MKRWKQEEATDRSVDMENTRSCPCRRESHAGLYTSKNRRSVPAVFCGWQCSPVLCWLRAGSAAGCEITIDLVYRQKLKDVDVLTGKCLVHAADSTEFTAHTAGIAVVIFRSDGHHGSLWRFPDPAHMQTVHPSRGSRRASAILVIDGLWRPGIPLAISAA